MHPQRTSHPVLEHLEDRSVPALLIQLTQGTLSITGTNAAETITLWRRDDRLGVLGEPPGWGVSQVKRILIDARGGDDRIRLDSETVSGQRALGVPVTVLAGAGNDTVLGSAGTDFILGQEGNDSLLGNAGNDYLDGGTGNDSLIGGIGHDRLHGDLGDDALWGQLGNDTLVGGADNDVLRGGGDNDTLGGNAGGDILWGENGVNSLWDNSTGNRLNRGSAQDQVVNGHFDWFEGNVTNHTVRTWSRLAFFDDRTLGRGDWMKICEMVAADRLVDASELASLRTLVTAKGADLLNMPTPVRVLANKVVNGDPANGQFQGLPLGNVAAGSSGVILNRLVDKWFRGLDRPVIDPRATYRVVQGTLFGLGPSYAQVFQGSLGNCGFLSALQGLALRNPEALRSLFIDNGDGTYIVRFYKPNGQVDYVTVDRQLPTASGRFVWNGSKFLQGTAPFYAAIGRKLHTNGWSYSNDINNSGNVLWVALLEKAFAQVNESGWLGTGDPWHSNENDYTAALDGIRAQKVLQHLTNRPGQLFTLLPGSFTGVMNALKAGKPIVFGTRSEDGQVASNLIASHTFTLVSYNMATQKFTLVNAWGIHGGFRNGQFKPGLVTLTWTQILASFGTWFTTKT